MYPPSIETEAHGFRNPDRDCSAETFRPDSLKWRITMSIKTKIAAIAALASIVAGPAFALDQDTAAVTTNSGRYAAQQVTIPSGAYASVRKTQSGVQFAHPAATANDFQLQGRGL
jgi:hypothetical protein